MRFSFKISKCAATKSVVLLGIFALFFTTQSSLRARPIEFSEPSNPTLATNVNSLATKPSLLPDIIGNSRSSPMNQNFSQSLAPLPAQAVVPSRDAQRLKNWSLMTPDEMMRDMLERDGLKVPGAKDTDDDLDPSASMENLYLHRMAQRNRNTNSFGAFDARGRFGRTNDWGNSSDGFDGYDPFQSNAGKNPDDNSAAAKRRSALFDFFKSRDVETPESLREKKAEEDQLDAFRKMIAPPTVTANPSFSSPSASARPGGYGNLSLPSSTFNSTPGVPTLSPMPTPSAPTVPMAPAAPGQTSLTPYTAPSKPKPVGFSAPQRTF
jgi:hypothetical protein